MLMAVKTTKRKSWVSSLPPPKSSYRAGTQHPLEARRLAPSSETTKHQQFVTCNGA